MSTFLYFAYGSNMPEKRIKARCSSAEKISTALLRNYALKLNKKSKDDSYKANLSLGNESDVVYGVIYKILKTEEHELDKFEGYRSKTGDIYHADDTKYVPIWVKVLKIDDNSSVKVRVYIAPALETEPNPAPYDWYLKHIITGAEENAFPDYYVKKLNDIETKKDLNAEREDKEMKIYRNQTE